jgi:hypothetical protein
MLFPELKNRVRNTSKISLAPAEFARAKAKYERAAAAANRRRNQGGEGGLSLTDLPERVCLASTVGQGETKSERY